MSPLAPTSRLPGPVRSGSGVSPADLPLLPVALALLAVAAFLLNAPFATVVRDLTLPDNDDTMRLVQVLDLIHGQGWFDKVQHRYMPPAGAPTHWSRLVDLPLALGIAALRPLVGERLAAGLVAAAWPPLLLAAYLAGLWFAARRWFGVRAAWLAVLAATQLATIGLFSPGRIDHHNLQILAMLGLAVALWDPAAGRGGAVARGVAAGASAALSLAIGLETLPFVALAGAVAALGWAVAIPFAAPRLLGFGAALALVAPTLFALETAPSGWLAPHCDALSAPWLMVACLGGSGAVLLALLTARLPTLRSRLAAAVAAAGGALAPLALYPACLSGPFAALPEIVRREWLGRVAEALSLPDALAFSPEMVAAGLVPLGAGAAFLLVRARAARSREERCRDLAVAAFLALGLAVAAVQLRGIYIGSALLPLVAGRALDVALARLAGGREPGRALLAMAVAVATLGKVAALPVLAAQEAGAWRPPAGLARLQPGCMEERHLRALDREPPATILAPVELGTALLLRTRHAIVAAPYHREAAGIAAALVGFGGREADLEAAVRDTGAGIVALCRSWVAGNPGSFAHALAAGAPAPWLEPIATEGDLAAWRVVALRPAR